jgi:hypothetical protein
MAVPRTRLDPLVGIRKRTEETALTVLATARRALGTAQEKLAGAIAQARVDYRDQDDSAFWIVEEAPSRSPAAPGWTSPGPRPARRRPRPDTARRASRPRWSDGWPTGSAPTT